MAEGDREATTDAAAAVAVVETKDPKKNSKSQNGRGGIKVPRCPPTPHHSLLRLAFLIVVRCAPSLTFRHIRIRIRIRFGIRCVSCHDIRN